MSELSLIKPYPLDEYNNEYEILTKCSDFYRAVKIVEVQGGPDRALEKALEDDGLGLKRGTHRVLIRYMKLGGISEYEVTIGGAEFERIR